MELLQKQLPKRVKIQPKLQVNQPGDHFEQEADAMADRVMRMRDTHQPQSGSGPVTGVIGRSVQRKCAHCEEEEKKKLMRKEAGGSSASQVSPSFTSTLHSAQGGGNKMNREMRHSMEGAFNADFSSVRIHRDSTADQLARSVSALAFTYGNDIYFKDGAYAETGTEGKRLLAHELTHVLQQGGGAAMGQIQRDEDTETKKSRSDLSKAFEKNDLFQKLPKFAQDKILDELDKAPETITNAVLDKIIDAVAPEEYKEGLKKAGEALIQKLFGKNKVSRSICDAYPGYHEGTSSTFKGQCCSSSTESEQTCCPKDRFAPNESLSPCCKPGQVLDYAGKCFTPQAVDVNTMCIPPIQEEYGSVCCKPPNTLINGFCQLPPPVPKPPTPTKPFSLSFTLGVIDDYDINQSVINSRQKEKFETIKKQIHEFMQACPASLIYITGHTDKPGTEPDNFDLAQRRADHVKFLLQLDLIKINFRGMGPMILTFSEGESKPVEDTDEKVYSSKNRRVEIEFTSVCPPLGSSGTNSKHSDL